MGGIIGFAILLIAGVLLVAPSGGSVPPHALAAIEAWARHLDWSSAGIGFAAGAVLGRLAGVRWGEIPGRMLGAMSYHGRGFSLLGWVLVLGAFVVLF
jgi:hypothetical protein